MARPSCACAREGRSPAIAAAVEAKRRKCRRATRLGSSMNVILLSGIGNGLGASVVPRLRLVKARRHGRLRSMPSGPGVRAVIFDAGYTLLEMDYPEVTGFLRSRGHIVDPAAVIDAERRARMRLDAERAEEATRERTGVGRYVRYLLEYLGIVDDAERRTVAEWRREFNVPIGLCHQADGQAAKALASARGAGLVVGVISNSNGSVRLALERAGLAGHLDFVIDSSVVKVTKPDARIFRLGLEASGTRPDATVYVGDSYFVDVVGARQAGLGAVLFDPGRVSAARDCAVAGGLDDAVTLALDESRSTRERLFEWIP